MNMHAAAATLTLLACSTDPAARQSDLLECKAVNVERPDVKNKLTGALRYQGAFTFHAPTVSRDNLAPNPKRPIRVNVDGTHYLINLPDGWYGAVPDEFPEDDTFDVSRAVERAPPQYYVISSATFPVLHCLPFDKTDKGNP